MGVMPAHKRTAITVETELVMTVRRRRSLRVWCRECGAVVDTIGLEEAAALAGTKPATLTDQAGAEGWHLCEGRDGETLICLESVLRAM
jgi:hypothetical protein